MTIQETIRAVRELLDDLPDMPCRGQVSSIEWHRALMDRWREFWGAVDDVKALEISSEETQSVASAHGVRWACSGSAEKALRGWLVAAEGQAEESADAPWSPE